MVDGAEEEEEVVIRNRSAESDEAGGADETSAAHAAILDASQQLLPLADYIEQNFSLDPLDSLPLPDEVLGPSNVENGGLDINGFDEQK